MDSTDKHSQLIDAGWRVDLSGRWHSPHPTDRFTFRTVESAWAAHLAHTFTEDAPA
jgi:hypothetical protein